MRMDQYLFALAIDNDDLKPSYAGTTMSNEWLTNRLLFQHWLNDHRYFYPDEKLELDKDLLSLGKLDKYCSAGCCILPYYLNMQFVDREDGYGYYIRKSGDYYVITPGPSTYKRFDFQYEIPAKFNDLEGARKVGRKLKADYLHHIAKKERERGYIPEYILDAIERAAKLTERGKIKMFEREGNSN